MGLSIPKWTVYADLGFFHINLWTQFSFVFLFHQFISVFIYLLFQFSLVSISGQQQQRTFIRHIRYHTEYNM